jgi:hypothetical protein
MTQPRKAILTGRLRSVSELPSGKCQGTGEADNARALHFG